jgi:5-hydroxyisourate hydrolase
MQRSPITTHVLDTSKGCPAQGIQISLEKQINTNWQNLASGITNTDGRVADLLSTEKPFESGIYRLTFETSHYFAKQGLKSFYPFVTVTFEIQNSEQHYHIPLLISPFGYSTYRGS